ncbi:MAG TPA: LLM class flavin-dependent oxidoreductase [Pseudomonadales bacterium]|nr:LLM class flavin-dependent oxidoreductase [Pseudomonadales bacterium]
MRIGMTIPFMEPGWNRQTMQQWAVAIDNGPWASLALGERITFINPEFMTSLAACAAWTNRVELISTVSVLTMHNPVLMAKQFATIDVIADGRLTVGVGLGGRREDYEAIGADWGHHRIARLEENVSVLRRIWHGEQVLPRAKRIVEPLPVQTGGPKILAGVIGPKSIAAAARYADGLSGFSFMASLDDIRQSFDAFRAAWQAEGRTGKPRLIASFWYGIEQKGKQQMVRHLDRYLNFMPDELARQLAPVAGFNGSIEALKNFLQEIESLGADDVILVPTSTDLEEIQTIARAVF